MYRIVIGGSRDYRDYDRFCALIDECLEKLNIKDEIQILSGHCSGTDALAERYAAQRGFRLEIYPAQWERYGRAAGPKRNEQMVLQSSLVIAFWNGASKGTKHLLDCAARFCKPVYIFLI